ncbi:uncharacterized protein BDV14DRAFT_200754 [Aspergillus stella-maris]|uniref:uncharacterized protein n=1 Tax=Aspergillus stella-maris TaxID=1810926 RepID=UPI003CCE17E4
MPPDTPPVPPSPSLILRNFSNLRISPTLDLYLLPCRSLSTPQTPTTHWILILSPSNTPGRRCTYLHIHKVREGPKTHYFAGTLSHNEPPPQSSPLILQSGISNLTQFKLCKVPETLHEEVITIAASSLANANIKRLPWTMSFLLALEEARFVPDGTRTYYDRFCEPFWDEIEETMRDLGLDARRESLVAMMRAREMEKEVEERRRLSAYE